MDADSKPRAERRWGPRMPVDLPVRLALPQGRVEDGRMRNLSISGALIECAAELPAFTTLRVEIFITANQSPGIQLGARVVRAEHPRLGVEWRDVPPQALADLLKDGSADVVNVER
ncbi:MAG TPA: PilZ domain-containing protein [Steroidobacteraceae bacterium]|nr:PilZ domain-containing protein [Steroidobacteraceae bacterium]